MHNSLNIAFTKLKYNNFKSFFHWSVEYARAPAPFRASASLRPSATLPARACGSGLRPSTQTDYISHKNESVNLYNAQRGARTHDPEIKSLVLYRLRPPNCPPTHPDLGTCELGDLGTWELGDFRWGMVVWAPEIPTLGDLGI